MLSQTVEYALRAMSSLAYRPNDLVPTSELAETTKVPSNYLAKVLQTLAGADLIMGRRGVGGGYRLSRAPEEISLLEVVNAVNPVERITTCPLGLDNHGPNLCPLHRRMDEAARLVMELFGSTTLADIVSGEGTPQLPLCSESMTQQIRIERAGK
ncbi:MAG: Rrf2 family transcriptional regulator [Planctomycetota bacterium]|nr:Rrf2 family transcriptional regulator [Planctomycetota bacterium]